MIVDWVYRQKMKKDLKKKIRLLEEKEKKAQIQAEPKETGTEQDEIDLSIPKEIEDNPEAKGFWLIEKALSVPMVKVNRSDYLRDTLGGKVSDRVLKKAISEGTASAGIPLEIIKKCAKNEITSTKTRSTTESAVTGLPGQVVGISLGVVGDLLQFYINFIKMIQKLCYLYGMPEIDCYDDVKNNNKLLAQYIAIYLGVSMGVEGANKVLSIMFKSIGSKYSKQAGKTFLLFSKPLFYSTAKKVAKSIGVGITKKGFAKAASKFVPVIGAGVSGALNWITFSPMASKLDKALQENYQKLLDGTLQEIETEDEISDNDSLSSMLRTLSEADKYDFPEDDEF